MPSREQSRPAFQAAVAGQSAVLLRRPHLVCSRVAPDEQGPNLGGFMPQDFLDIHAAISGEQTSAPLANDLAKLYSTEGSQTTGGFQQNPALEQLTPEPSALAWIRKETLLRLSYDDAIMLISHSQANFMQLLAKMLSAQRVVEVGTFTGYSAAAWALAMGPSGRVVSIDCSAEHAELSSQGWTQAGVSDKIEFIHQDGLQALEEQVADSADIVFLDADKERSNLYVAEAKRVVRPGGLVLLDDALWSSRIFDNGVQDPETMGIRDAVHGALSSKSQSALVPIGDGLLMVLVH